MHHTLVLIIAIIIGIYTTIAIFYEMLCLSSLYIKKHKLSHHATVFTSAFIAHAISITIYAGIYWVLIHHFNFSGIEGNIENYFPTYLYFSATTYSSLGIGDVFPIESLRFLAGIQAINGLILITWSAASSYSEIQQVRDNKKR